MTLTNKPERMSRKKTDTVIRTCVICRRRMAKATLERYVWQSVTRAVALDQGCTMAGRGAYCCKDESCRERFLTKKQGWKRAFRLN
jgi:predicted RNA-binding protein YlxR (DUF448 family)